MRVYRGGGGVGVLVKVFKKKTTESGFCLVFGVGWGWRCPQKKKKNKAKKRREQKKKEEDLSII